MYFRDREKPKIDGRQKAEVSTAPNALRRIPRSIWVISGIHARLSVERIMTECASLASETEALLIVFAGHRLNFFFFKTVSRLGNNNTLSLRSLHTLWSFGSPLPFLLLLEGFSSPRPEFRVRLCPELPWAPCTWSCKWSGVGCRFGLVSWDM